MLTFYCVLIYLNINNTTFIVVYYCLNLFFFFKTKEGKIFRECFEELFFSSVNFHILKPFQFSNLDKMKTSRMGAESGRV